MAWVFIVVYVTAEGADAIRWRVHQAHVANDQLLDQVVFQAVVEAANRTAIVVVALTLFYQGLTVGLDLLVAFQRIVAEVFGDLVADIGDGFGDIETFIRTGRRFVRLFARQEAIGDVVVLFLAVVLNCAIGTVVIRYN